MTEISFLADRPEFLDALAEATFTEYADVSPERTIAWRVVRLQGHLNHTALPIAWVAHEGSTLLGTAALRADDFEGLEHLTPWLGGVFVLPEARGEGVGRALCEEVERVAVRRGVAELYLGTFDQQRWFESMGWEVLQPGTLRGRPCDVMHKRLVVPASADHATALEHGDGDTPSAADRNSAPTLRTDLAADASAEVTVPADGAAVERWTAHPEMSCCPR